MQHERPCEVCRAKTFRSLGDKVGHQFVACSTCGLERIDPPPSDEELQRIYGAHYFNAWGLHQSEDSVRKVKLGTFRRVLRNGEPLFPGAKVLDCGAATGFMMELLEEKGAIPYGLELSEFGAQKIEMRFGKGRVFRGQLEDAEFAGAARGTFHALYMCDYIEHVRDPARILGLALEWLAPGGTLTITTPSTSSWSHKLMRMGWTHYKAEHLHYFSPSNMERLLRGIGFRDIHFSPLWKTMDAEYIAHQLSVYGPPWTRWLFERVPQLPSFLRNARFPIMMGELVVRARK